MNQLDGFKDNASTIWVEANGSTCSTRLQWITTSCVGSAADAAANPPASRPCWSGKLLDILYTELIHHTLFGSAWILFIVAPLWSIQKYGVSVGHGVVVGRRRYQPGLIKWESNLLDLRDACNACLFSTTSLRSTRLGAPLARSKNKSITYWRLLHQAVQLYQQ
jgi:hypothetical protein